MSQVYPSMPADTGEGLLASQDRREAGGDTEGGEDSHGARVSLSERLALEMRRKQERRETDKCIPKGQNRSDMIPVIPYYGKVLRGRDYFEKRIEQAEEVCDLVKEQVKGHPGQKILYHFTNEMSMKLIQKSGLLASASGQAGGGIYWSEVSPLEYQWPAKGWIARATEDLFGADKVGDASTMEKFAWVIAVRVRRDALVKVAGRKGAYLTPFYARPHEGASKGMEHFKVLRFDSESTAKVVSDRRWLAKPDGATIENRRLELVSVIERHGGSGDSSNWASEKKAALASAHLSLAHLLQEKYEDYVKAWENLKRSLELKPSYARAQISLGYCLATFFEDFDAAKKCYESALSADPTASEFCMAHCNLALLLEEKFEDKEGAQQHYESVLQLCPSSEHASVALTNLGVLLVSMGKWKEALRHWVEVVEAFPEHVNTHINLAILYEEIFQDFECAAEHYEKAISIEGGAPSPLPYRRLGLLLRDKVFWRRSESTMYLDTAKEMGEEIPPAQPWYKVLLTSLRSIGSFLW
uniref:Uncharacterized protein n=1 Tax=Chromera velia CCMP2878 TaxID=1169474 RepID=A0A0G4G0Y9_9ALVE|eukprot:Cvel_19604.t1-p1 / transcript=Cvel_19604.t1 / gene=Cvel_19604 / organism=Chromera_velia_CCMP2878 / gene_product=UDP-N-acetylglucosamine--peptide, putative / transcript_product=UDP-N-acetylglucosamine--peptide, putative / location=Cvel_scaffold1704:16560-20116(+) / protein_length=526 / sequence_SO=supercontig / SO=protein_coding / is_pseudo=false